MSSLTYKEKEKLEELFVKGGYVLEFNNKTFGEFFRETVDIDIHADKYCTTGESNSKAKKLRKFWKIEDDSIVGTAMKEMIDRVRVSNSDHFDEEKTTENAKKIENLKKECSSIIDKLLEEGRGSNLYLHKQIANYPTFNQKHFRDKIKRIEDALKNGDVELAIGTAKELIESCCKTILSERNSSLKNTSPKIQDLIKETMKNLKLTSDDIDEKKRVAML
jgi:hypothetical protein